MCRVNCRATVRWLRRRATSLTMLAVYVVTAAGVPLPSGNHVHKSGELFPCANCPCGCATAEQCWRSCCCHTLAERMAWAREHGVRPPEYAIAEAMRGGMDVAWLGQIAPGCAGGSKCVQPSVCSVIGKPPAEPGADGRVSGRTCCHCRAVQATDEQPRAKVAGHVIAWRALSCKGQSSNWLAAVPTWFDEAQSFDSDLHLIQWLGPASSDHVAPVGELPATPPPEVA
jgi:hypothetical protein